VPSLLRSLMAADLGRPRLTWYGAGGERVELSAKTLDNWVAKTANLLVDTLDAGPGTRVMIDLPPHWRTAVWLLGTWAVGGCALDTGVAEVVVTTRPAAALAAAPPFPVLPADAYVVAMALPALAPSFGPDLPDDAVDGNIGIRTHGDVFVPIVRPTPDDLATADVTHGDLFAQARSRSLSWQPPDADAGRLLVPTSHLDPCVGSAPGWLLAPLLGNGSVVLVDDTALSPEALARITAQEGITATLTP
jgi:uncharacterized protein (TIGR03089 family)